MAEFVRPQHGLNLVAESDEVLTGFEEIVLNVDEDPGKNEDDPIRQETVYRFTGGKGSVDVQLLQFRNGHTGDHSGQGNS